MRGRVVHVCTPRGSGLRIVVGTLRKQMQGENGRVMLIPSNRALPYFVVPRAAERYFLPRDREAGGRGGEGGGSAGGAPTAPPTIQSGIFRAEYNPSAWLTGMRFPPARSLTPIGNAFDPEDETRAILTQFDVDHCDFEPTVLRDVEKAVKSGRTRTTAVSGADGADKGGSGVESH